VIHRALSSGRNELRPYVDVFGVGELKRRGLMG
jgi:hypothetical protein